jgi:hypothetical protein
MRGVSLLGEMSEWTAIIEKIDTSSCSCDTGRMVRTSYWENTPSALRIEGASTDRIVQM